MKTLFMLLLAALAVAATAGPVKGQENFFNGTTAGDFRLPITTWRDLPFQSVVRQKFDFSCGSAAIATVLRHHHGLAVDEAAAFQAMWREGDQARIRKLGFSMLDMKRYAGSLGFQADGFRIGLDELARFQRPAIALLDVDGYKHFVVVKGVRGAYVLLGDPNRGLRLEQRTRFESQWNGIAFILHKGPTAAAYDLETEWARVGRRPMRANMATTGEVLREVFPPYQITPVRLIGFNGQ